MNPGATGGLRRSRLFAWLLAAPLVLPALWLASAYGEPQPEVWPHLFDQVLPLAARNTLGLLVLIAVVAMVLGVGFAWASARYDWPGRRLFDWALVLPLALPAYVVAFVYVGLADYAGPLQTTWRALGLPSASFPELRSVPGAALSGPSFAQEVARGAPRQPAPECGAERWEHVRSEGKGCAVHGLGPPGWAR